jgi:hypothetical protein
MEMYSSANNHELSFAYAYQWSEPDQDLTVAMKILTCPALGSETASCPCAEEQSQSARITGALAANPQTPPMVLDHLVNCGVPFVLVRIAENPRSSAETLRKLAGNESVSVRTAVAENYDAPVDVHKKLAQDECVDVRFAVAENANLPPDILEVLIRDENPYVAHRAQTTLTRLEEKTRQVAQTANLEIWNLNFPNNRFNRKRAGS